MNESSKSDSPDSRSPSSVASKKAIIAFALALLWLPLLVSLIEEDRRESRLDNRMLAAVPDITWTRDGIQRLPRDLDRYYDDHLGFRSTLIAANAWLKIRLLGISPSEKLIVGRRGWFYLADAHVLDQYQGLARFDDHELERWGHVLEERHRWLSERGIEYLVVFVPNKSTIYPEFMPRTKPRLSDHSQLAQLLEHLQKNADLSLLDLRPYLANAKLDKRVYHRTDTHWNDLGAYLAYEQILARLENERWSLEPAPVRFERREQKGLGLVRLVGLSESFPEEMLVLELEARQAKLSRQFRGEYTERVTRQLPVSFERPGSNLPRAVMFRDSFANTLIPYLSENFSRILYVWDMNIRPRVIERERPDYVIQQITERMLWRSLRSLEEIRAAGRP